MANAETSRIRVQVCYALPDAQTLIDVEVAVDATIGTAIEQSGMLARHPDIDLQRQRVGVFGALRALDAALADGDRIEIYRPLTVDPKLARQRRVAKVRAGGSREGRRWLNKDSR